MKYELWVNVGLGLYECSRDHDSVEAAKEAFGDDDPYTWETNKDGFPSAVLPNGVEIAYIEPVEEPDAA